jgi:hypothetical protein
VKQQVIEYIGKEVNGKPIKKVSSYKINIKSVKCYMDIKVVYKISEEPGIPDIL